MTGIPETRCFKILCKFSFLAKKYVTSLIRYKSIQTNKCFMLTNHIRSHIKASGHKLTLITSLKKNFISFGLALVVGVSTFARATNNSLLSTELVSFLVVSMLTSFTASAIERSIVYPWSYNAPSNMYTFCLTIDHKFSIGFKSLEQGGNAISLSFLSPLFTS